MYKNLETKTFRKKDLLLKKGHVSRHIFFIEKGLVRSFYTKDNKEVTAWFMKEGDIIISVESFFNQQTNYESIEALEDCNVQYISYDKLQYMYKNFPELNFIARVITESYYIKSEQRLHSIKMQTARERYAYLLTHFPELIQRVPATHLASYLGIRLETLSRLKSN